MVATSNFSREQSPFYIISQEHVERVRQLVRFHADQARLHAVDGAVEVLGGRFFRVRKGLVEERRGVLPKRFGLQDHALPQQALALVRAHGQRLRDR